MGTINISGKADIAVAEVASKKLLKDNIDSIAMSIESLKNETVETLNLVCDSLDVIRNNNEKQHTDIKDDIKSLFSTYKYQEKRIDQLSDNVEKIEKDLKSLKFIACAESIVILGLVAAVIYLFSTL